MLMYYKITLLDSLIALTREACVSCDNRPVANIYFSYASLNCGVYCACAGYSLFVHGKV